MKRLQRFLTNVSLLGLLFIFLGCAPPTKSSSVALEEDDALITSTIGSKFFYERTLRTSRIYVNTEQGVVYLTGFVEKAPYVETATRIAHETPGVVAVREQLVVKN